MAATALAGPAPRPLKARSEPGLIARLRHLLRRAAPRAQVIAPPEVHLGERFDVEWRLDHGGRDVTNVSVTLVSSCSWNPPPPRSIPVRASRASRAGRRRSRRAAWSCA